MRYQGGKSRIAADIAAIINRQVEGGDSLTFVSLFCGSCAVEAHIRGFKRVVCNDKHEYLIALLQGVQRGYELPDEVSAEQYKYIREHKTEDPVLTGFTGFGCSFGGKWFGGYARSQKDRSFAAESKRSLLRDMVHLQNAEFICNDYRNVSIPRGAVIYADPPYANTTDYRFEKFDTEAFWLCMRLLAETGHTVFISEQTAPKDFVAIWEKPFMRQIDRNKNNQFVVTEKLFIYGGKRL